MEDNFKLPELPIIGPKRPDEAELKKSEEFLCPYIAPAYSGPLPDKTYSFEVLKHGVIVEMINNLEEKPYHVFGRLPVPNVEINSAHPTSSRFHCVLQYRPAGIDEDSNEKEIEEGWYIYDLGKFMATGSLLLNCLTNNLIFIDSTHGTFLNKNRIKPRMFVRMHVGHQLKLGNSTRCYILQGPPEDEEEQSEFTISELKQQKLIKEAERKQKELDEKLELERLAKEKEEEGISWGMMMADAEDEPDLTENPFAATNNEELFIHDPKKTLRGFFEREGYDLEYKCDELSPGVFICRVELPIDDEFGKPMICEVQHKGKKKECVVQCALEACRMLDRQGVLRQANHEPRRKRKVSDSDSDDDIFFDRTGDVEKKRLKKSTQPEKEALTFEQLTEQEQEILMKITVHEKELNEMIENEKKLKQQNQADDDDLDSFMSHLTDKKVDKFEIRNMKNELQNMKLELAKVQKLINIVKPSVILPPISQSKPKLPLFGKRNRLPRDFGIKKTTETAKSKKDDQEFEIEEDEDDVKEQPSSSAEKSVPKDISKSKFDELAEKVKKVSKAMEIEGSKDPVGSNAGKSSSKDLEMSKPSSKDPELQKSISKSTEIVKSTPELSTKLESSSKDPEQSIESKPADPVQSTEVKTVIIPPELKKCKVDEASTDKSSLKEPDNPQKITDNPTDEAATKKSKKPQKPLKSGSRYRANIDINDDDEYIDEEKVSMWLPPENQSGDGTSHLNNKFGY